MSLINQMLRDLEQRKPNQSEPSQPLSIQLPQPVKTGNNSKFLWIVLIAIAVGVVVYQNIKQSPLTPISAEKPQNSVALQSKTRIDNDTDISLAPTEVSTGTEVEIAPEQQPSQNAEASLSLTASNDNPLNSTLAANTNTTIQPTPKAVSVAQTSPTSTTEEIIKLPKPSQNPPDNKSAQKVKNQTPSTRRTTESNTQALYRQAQNSASFMMRKEILKDLLAIDPQNLSARNLLLQTLLKSNAQTELDMFLQESLQLFPNHLAFITTQAHRQIQRKQFSAAISTLERVDSRQINEPTYLSLLAASYQQQQQYQQAAAIYQKLTIIQPDKAEHWLGLGICEENLHHNQTAIMAYQQALNKNTLNSPVVDYIKQRLISLN